MDKQTIDKANELARQIKSCENKITTLKIFKSEPFVKVCRDLSDREDKWKFWETEFFPLILEKDELAKKYFLQLLDALIEREAQTMKALQEELDEL